MIKLSFYDSWQNAFINDVNLGVTWKNGLTPLLKKKKTLVAYGQKSEWNSVSYIDMACMNSDRL